MVIYKSHLIPALDSGPTIVDNGTAVITDGDIANKFVCRLPSTNFPATAAEIERFREVRTISWTEPTIHQNPFYSECRDTTESTRVKRHIYKDAGGGEWDSNSIPFTIQPSFSK